MRPGRLRAKRVDREGADECTLGAWNANWAWSLPSIVLNVVIHESASGTS